MGGVPTYISNSAGTFSQGIITTPQPTYDLPGIGKSTLTPWHNDFVSWEQINRISDLGNFSSAPAWGVTNNPDLATPRGPEGQSGANLFPTNFTLFTDPSMAWSPATLSYLATVGETGQRDSIPFGGYNTDPKVNGLLDIGSPKALNMDYVIKDNKTGAYYYPMETVHAGGASGASALPYTGATPNQTPIAIPNSPLNTTMTFQAPGTSMIGGNGQAASPFTDILKKKQQGGAANSGLQTPGIGGTLLSSDNSLLKQLVGS